jgi:hypothetical protein
MKATSIFISMVVYSISVMGQTNQPQKMIDDFFSLYKSKTPDAALDYIFNTNKWMNESKDQIDNVKFKLNSALKNMGDLNGYTLITKKTLTEHLALYTYLVRYDRQPLRFSFLFYKPESQWRLHNFSFDAALDEELEEATRAYRLKENQDF